MNYLKASVIGLDAVIQRIQTELYDTLKVEWLDSIDAYGRIYKNTDKEGNFIPEFYVGGGEYKSSYYNDEKACTFFFIEDDTHPTEDELVFVAPVKCVFMVNLAKLFPTSTDRDDLEAQRDVMSILRNKSFEEFQITGIEKGLSNIFTGLETKGIKFSDIHPYNSFSINIDLSYYITDKC